jgi:hypothetical protein
VTSPADMTGLLAARMADAQTQWSIGTFGAIAEFARDADEPVALVSLTAVTDRGAISIEPQVHMQPFAFEMPTKSGSNRRIALCLVQGDCTMSRRTVLTELGADTGALRDCDRSGTLFDLGLGALQVDCCIRVADPDIATQLRAHCGRPVFESEAMNIIVPASPHRVFLSRVGRIEVFQPIPPPHGRSPDGPHTHVLPALLRQNRTHAGNEPIPDGLVPCAHIYLAHAANEHHHEAHA